MKQSCFWITITILLLVAGCRPHAAAPTMTPSPTDTPTKTPTITWTPSVTFTSTSTFPPEPTIDLTYAYEAIHRTPVEQIPYSLDCTPDGKMIKCHDTLLGLSFQYPQGLWTEIQPKLEWGGYNGYEYSYFVDSSTDWPIAGGRSRIYSEGREPIIFDLGMRESADTQEDICGWFSASACIEVKPDVYLAIMSSDAKYCESIPTAAYWGWWYPSAVIAMKLPEQSIINAFSFNTPFLTTADLKQPYSFINLTDTSISDPNSPMKCESENIEKYNQFFIDIIRGHWDNVSSEARIKFEKIAHLADSIEFDK